MKRLVIIAVALAIAACASAPTKQTPPQPTPAAATPTKASPEKVAPGATAKPIPSGKPVAAPAPGQAPQAPTPRPADQTSPEPGQRPDRPAAVEGPPEPRPYDRVITKEYKTSPGVFAVHRLKDKIYYEIPKKELGKDFLWVSQIAKTTLGVGYGGQALGNRVVRWERNDNRVLLRGVSYERRRRPVAPGREGGRRGEQRGHHHGLQRRGGRERRGAGHRRHAALHDRRAGVQRPHAPARHGVRREPLLPRARRRRSPRTSRSRHAHLHGAVADPAPAAAGAEPVRRRPACVRQRHRA